MQPFNTGTPFVQEQGVSGTPMVDPRGQQRRTGERNKKIGFMLYALGGALKGDKNFVQNTMALQEISDAKEKQEKQNKLWTDWVDKNKETLDPQLQSLAEILPPEKGIELVSKSFGSDRDTFERFGVFKNGQQVGTVLKDDMATIADINLNPDLQLGSVTPSYGDDGGGTESERKNVRYLELKNKDPKLLSSPEQTELALLAVEIFGADPVPFFNSEGKQVDTLRPEEIALNPNIYDEMANQGLYTIGVKPGFAPKGVQSGISTMQESYLNAKGQLDTINDLATIIYTNKDANTFAGGLANLVNSGRYQALSAERLFRFEEFAKNNPKEAQEYQSKIDKMLDEEYGAVLDRISQDRAVAKSIFLKLAYGTAKQIDPSGRLSDNDVKIAMEIIGKLGANWKANLAVLENLSKETRRIYSDQYGINFGNLTTDIDKNKAVGYQDIPQFLNGADWRSNQSLSPTTSGGDSDVDAILNELLL